MGIEVDALFNYSHKSAKEQPIGLKIIGRMAISFDIYSDLNIFSISWDFLQSEVDLRLFVQYAKSTK